MPLAGSPFAEPASRRPGNWAESIRLLAEHAPLVLPPGWRRVMLVLPRDCELSQRSPLG